MIAGYYRANGVVAFGVVEFGTLSAIPYPLIVPGQGPTQSNGRALQQTHMENQARSDRQWGVRARPRYDRSYRPTARPCLAAIALSRHDYARTSTRRWKPSDCLRPESEVDFQHFENSDTMQSNDFLNAEPTALLACPSFSLAADVLSLTLAFVVSQSCLDCSAVAFASASMVAGGASAAGGVGSTGIIWPTEL